MTTYNHAYSISFAVSNSENADPHEAWVKEKDKVINALMTRIDELLVNDDTYRECVDVFDTYDE